MEDGSDNKIISTVSCLQSSNHRAFRQENVLVHSIKAFRGKGAFNLLSNGSGKRNAQMHRDKENMKRIKQMSKMLLMHESEKWLYRRPLYYFSASLYDRNYFKFGGKE